MRRVSGLITAFALAASMATPAVAAEDAKKLQVDEVDVAEYPTVTATVTAPRELVGRDLADEAFTVREEGNRRPVTVTRVPNDDLEVIVLLDTSGSMAPSMAATKEAAIGFVDRLPPSVRVGVMGFGTEPTVAQTFTTDKEALTDAVNSLEPRGETALYDAVNAALALFPTSESARRSVVLLSDGGDTASTTTLDGAADQLDDSGVTLYAVELQTAESDPASLERLAEAADGRVVPASDTEALADVYDQIASELVNQYTLSFSSQGHGRTDLSIQINHDGVTATATQTVKLPPAPEPAPESEAAPDSGPATLQVISADTENFPEVELRVIAPRQLTQRELEAGDFTVDEGGRARHVDVTRIAAVDTEVVLSIDTSGSMAGAPLQAAKEAAIKFIKTMPPDTRVAVQAFSNTAIVVVPFTSDVAKLTAAINSLEAGQETALYDAMVGAAELFGDREHVSRSVVLLSDGGDTASSASLDDAGASLAAADAALHVVRLETPETDAAALDQLAEPSGVAVVPATDPASLSELYEGIAADVSNQYILRYRSDGAGPMQVRVGVHAAGVTAEGVKNVELPPLQGLSRLFHSRLGLFLGAAACYLAMAIVILMLLLPRERRVQIAGYARRNMSERTGLAELANRVTLAADHQLQTRGWHSALNTALENAGINLRPGEFVVLVACAMLGAAAIGLLMSGVLLAVLFIILTGVAARLLVSFLAQRRRARFADQLGETLQLLAGSLRSGYGIMQAIDSVAREADQPAADEFRRLLVETRLGRDLGDALEALAARAGNEDFQWVVQAMEIHREVGGDLAEVLDTVAGTIRERNQIRRQVKALSAEGRLSAYVLLALPFGVGFMVYLSNPSYIGELTNGGLLGWGMIGMGLLLMTVGTVWMRKVVRLVF